jgi:hypothetical protein
MSNEVQKKSSWAWLLPLVAVIIVGMHYASPAHRSSKYGAGIPHVPKKFSTYNCRVYQVPTGGWGYDILGDSVKTIIHQPFIPAHSGGQGFASKEDAMKVGELVIDKIKKGNFPPGVSYQEMKNIGVTLN